jgi:hypothetical protein
VRCRWFVRARLRVIGEKGEDLDGVELAGDVDDGTWDEIAPWNLAERDEEARKNEDGYSPLWIHAGRSPVEVPAEEMGLHNYWVRARDHAWARIAVAQGYGGERVVRLVRSGTLEARLAPFDPDVGVALQLYRDGEHALEWLPDETGFARIEGLPRGRFEVRACLGVWWREPRVFATTEVEIEPGTTKETTLTLRNPPQRQEPVPLEGTLQIDPGWHAAKQPFDLMGCEAQDIDVMDEAFGSHAATVQIEEDGRWSAGLVAPGQYCITLGPWMWMQVVEVGPQGTTDARLVVPPPCDVDVRLVDAATGAPVGDDDDVSWCVKSADTKWTSYQQKRQPCAAPGVWTFQAPVGTLVVGLYSDLHDAPSIEVDLKPGKNLVALKAAQNVMCDFALKDGAMPVPLDDLLSKGLKATAVEGDGGLDECGTGFPARVWFTKAGRYRVSFPPIEGYEPIAPVEVAVAAGKISRVEVQLHARP